jgi:hypothetical protein
MTRIFNFRRGDSYGWVILIFKNMTHIMFLDRVNQITQSCF